MATVTELPSAPASALPSETGPAPSGGDATKEKNDNWRFLEPQPVREEQVENAVKFLSHPKVKGSPVLYRRSFLERKGLSREEIDEAFRRVPDPPSDSSPSAVPAAGPGGPPNAPLQVVQAAVPIVQPNTRQVAAKSSSWTQMLLALGVLTAAGAGAGVLTKKYFIPKLKEWIQDVVSGKSSDGERGKAVRPSPVEEATTAAAAAAAAAATAATQVAAAMQEIASSKSKDRKRLDTFIKVVEAQTQELKNALAGLMDTVKNAEVTKYQRSVTNSFQSNGGGSEDYWKGQTNGVRPSAVSEGQAVRTLPINVGVSSDTSAGFYNNGQQVKQESSSPTNRAGPPPHSQSYLDIMAMLERGEKPPGIKEVNDKPPNPNQQPSNPRLQPRLKPWEKVALEAQAMKAATGQPGKYENWKDGSGSVVQSTVNTELTIGSGTKSSSEPWWRKKFETESAFSSSSVKITEVDLASEVDIGTVQVGQSSSSSSFYQGGGRAGWVPPAVPLPVYPGAEEAIRRVISAAGGSTVPSMPTPAENGSDAGPSSSFPTDESPIQVDVLKNSTQSKPESPDQHDKVLDEQEPQYLDRSFVDSTRTFKDVVQEEVVVQQ